MRKKKLLFLVILFLAGYSYAQTKVFMYNEDGTKEYFFVNNVVRYLQYDELSTPNLKIFVLNRTKNGYCNARNFEIYSQRI